MKKAHNKKHLVYSDGKILMYDNHCDACTGDKQNIQERIQELIVE